MNRLSSNSNYIVRSKDKNFDPCLEKGQNMASNSEFEENETSVCTPPIPVPL